MSGWLILPIAVAVCIAIPSWNVRAGSCLRRAGVPGRGRGHRMDRGNALSP